MMELLDTITCAPMAGDIRVLLSGILNIPVMQAGQKIGSLNDLVIVETVRIPEVRALYVSRPSGCPNLLIPWENVTRFDGKEIEIAISDAGFYETDPAGNAIFFRNYVLDRKVVDLEENEVEIVYDIRLVIRGGKLYVTEVDTGKAARLRMLGSGLLAQQFGFPANPDEEQMIPRACIQPLPTNAGRFRDRVTASNLRESLSGIHPVDLADILEEMDQDRRVIVFSSLDDEQASDTLEEIEPDVQREIISSLSVDKVVQLINDMTPGQAADVLTVLSPDEARGILNAMNTDSAGKVRSIITRREENVSNYSTQKILKFPPETFVEYIQNYFPRHASDKDIVMYIYVTDKEDHLLGIIDLKELLQAEDRAFLQDIMVENVISLSTDSSLKDAAQEFTRYGFRASGCREQNQGEKNADDHSCGLPCSLPVFGSRGRFHVDLLADRKENSGVE